MNPLYNAAMGLMKGAVAIGSWRSPKLRLMRRGHAQVWEKLREKLPAGKRPVWIHAASLGEFEQGRPLIERIRREHPDVPILLTFFSPSGYEVRKNYPLVDCVTYLPVDTPANARCFVETVNPRVAIFVKYEFWGNYLQQLQAHGIPTYIISAIFRPSQAFFKSWGGMYRAMLHRFTRLYVQDEASRELLAGIGVTNVTVAGDTRFDRVTDIMRATSPMPEIEAFTADAPLSVIIGSSWPLDEEVYLPWFNRHPEVKLIIAPHEFDDERVVRLLKSIEGSAVALSQFKPGDEKARALVVDCFGKLAAMYRYCDVAYIGGGFGTGIHNINEAAVYDMPVIFGPRYFRFKEARDLVELKGAFSIASREEFETIMDSMLDEATLHRAGKTAGDYVRSQIGATDKIYTDLCEVLK